MDENKMVTILFSILFICLLLGGIGYQITTSIDNYNTMKLGYEQNVVGNRIIWVKNSKCPQ